MRPLVVLLGIVMGSAVSIALGLLMTGAVFLLLNGFTTRRLAEEKYPLLMACRGFGAAGDGGSREFLRRIEVSGAGDSSPTEHCWPGWYVRRVDLLAQAMRRNCMNRFERFARSLGSGRARGFHNRGRRGPEIGPDR